VPSPSSRPHRTGPPDKTRNSKKPEKQREKKHPADPQEELPCGASQAPAQAPKTARHKLLNFNHWKDLTMSKQPKNPIGWPQKQGLWEPTQEKDSCGVGFVAHLKGERSHGLVKDALVMNDRMIHRGACGCEP